MRDLSGQQWRDRSRFATAGVGLALRLADAGLRVELDLVTGLVVQPFRPLQALSQMPIPARLRRQWEAGIGSGQLIHPLIEDVPDLATARARQALAGILNIDVGSVQRLVDVDAVRGLFAGIPNSPGDPGTDPWVTRPTPKR